MEQLLPFNLPPIISGTTYIAELDEVRLTGQWEKVWNVMVSGDWLTIQEIRNRIWLKHHVMCSEAGISARCRDFRKAFYGGHTVERRRRKGAEMRGIFEYKLTVRKCD